MTASTIPEEQSKTCQNRPIEKILIKQGAEALVYKTTFLLPNVPALLKYRPSKSYRHPILDQRLTKHRCLSEARLLIRARSMGIHVPAVYFVNETRGEIYMEWIDGDSIRDILDDLLLKDHTDGSQIVRSMLSRLGDIVGQLHAVHIIHGDLTTSNVMVQCRKRRGLLGEPAGNEPISPEEDSSKAGDGAIILIDFGLGSMSTQDEDMAVDLYVLERTFTSTHPKAESLFQDVLDAYVKSYKNGKQVIRRLQEVRLRGRKRSMVG